MIRIKRPGFIGEKEKKPQIGTIFSLLLTILILSHGGNGFCAANLSNLLETPLDRTDNETQPAYKYPSFVFGGIFDATVGSGRRIYVALGNGGAAVFNYNTGTTFHPYGIADRATSVEWIGEDVPISPVAVAGIYPEGSNHNNYMYVLSGPYCLAFSVDSTTGEMTFKDRVTLKDPNNVSITYEGESIVAVNATSTDVVLVGARQTTGTGGAIFAIKFDKTSEQWLRNSGEADFDAYQLAYPAYAITFFSATIKGSSATNYLAVTGPNVLDVFSISPSNVGGDDSQDAFSYVTGRSFGATGQALATYTHSDVHANPSISGDGQETLIFTGTNTGIYAFELDSEDNTTIGLTDFGNISSDIDSALNVKGIYAAGVTNSFRGSWVVAACGKKGVYVVKATGNNTAEDDTLAIQYIAKLDTSGESSGIIGVDGATSTDIDEIFVADGGGGIKVLQGSNLNDESTRSLDLRYQWDESAAPVDVEGISDYMVVLDRSGGVSAYSIANVSSGNVPAPMIETSSDGGGLGIDLGWSSRRSQYGTGSNLAGEPRALYVSGNSTAAHVFVAAGSGGIKYLRISNIDTTQETCDYPTSGASYKTDGEALGIDGFLNGTTYYLGVADGSSGVMFFSLDVSATSPSFQRKSKVYLNGTAFDISLVHNLSSDDYGVVAYGTAGLVIFKISPPSGGGTDYLSNPELVSTVDLGGSVTKVKVVTQTISGSTKYYAYCLVFDPQDSNIRKIVPVDITNPSAASVVTDGENPASYPGDNSLNPTPAGIVDFTPISGNNRYYLAVASSEQKTGSIGASKVFTINITNPAEMLYSNAISTTYEARCISSSGDGSYVLFGELGGQMADTGYMGLVGMAAVEITQASTITVTVSATPRTVEPGGTSIFTATPGGGSQPYFYSWSVTDKTGNDAGSVDNATIASPTWTAPAESGVYNVSVTVTDRDGNTGTGTATIQVQPLGVSISDRIVKPGGTVRVPLHVTGVGTDIDAFGVEASYDTTNLEYYGMEETSDTQGWTFSVNESPAGTLKIGGQANGNSAIPSGATADLAYLLFSASTNAPTCTSISISLSNGVDDIAGVNLTKGEVTIVMPGDLDGSCSLTPQDALNAFLYYLGLIDLREDEAKVADVDNDGMVTPNDAILILDMYVTGD